mmetsp:Transcript_12562/g.29760  ORF Transcript_12562/g.29760 Transcript_12562/m.29760 type:complete len:80 (+) Transcript_12562:41-280(+)
MTSRREPSFRKKDGTLAKTEAENGAVFCEHFNGVFNAPATAHDGIEEVIEQRETVPALGISYIGCYHMMHRRHHHQHRS